LLTKACTTGGRKNGKENRDRSGRKINNWFWLPGEKRLFIRTSSVPGDGQIQTWGRVLEGAKGNHVYRTEKGSGSAKKAKKIIRSPKNTETGTSGAKVEDEKKGLTKTP